MWTKSHASHASRARELDATDDRDRLGAADRRHGPAVAIAERSRRPAPQMPQDVVRRAAPLLGRDWGQSRQRGALVIATKTHVADHEYFGMSRQREIWLHRDAPGAIDPERPASGAAATPAAHSTVRARICSPAQPHRVRGDARDGRAAADLDAEALERGLGAAA